MSTIHDIFTQFHEYQQNISTDHYHTLQNCLKLAIAEGLLWTLLKNYSLIKSLSNLSGLFPILWSFKSPSHWIL